MMRKVPLHSGLMAILAIGCGDSDGPGAFGGPGGSPSGFSGATLSCTIPQSLLVDGGPGVDGIPALHNPPLVAPGDLDADYLRSDDRVIGLVIDGQPVAIPLNIMWWHEIVNLDMGGAQLAVTHCPLTGSSLTFLRDGAQFATLGVSGLLFMNNLVMYDRNTVPSLWPQMSRGARCGPESGTALPMRASLEMTWEGWQSLFPETRVVSAETGHARNYQAYPYGNYEDPWSAPFVPVQVDRRRPTKERVLGIPMGDSSGVALPFGVLDSLGVMTAQDVTVGGERMVVFWDRARQAAMAYHPQATDGDLTFQGANGAITDNETGSTWQVDGRAVSGPLEGEQLTAVAEAFVAYWFAWAIFYPEADLWLGPEGP